MMTFDTSRIRLRELIRDERLYITYPAEVTYH